MVLQELFDPRISILLSKCPVITILNTIPCGNPGSLLELYMTDMFVSSRTFAPSALAGRVVTGRSLTNGHPVMTRIADRGIGAEGGGWFYGKI